MIEVHRRYNGATGAQASRPLRKFDSGNTIGKEGCQLAALAMVLRLLCAKGEYWTPRTLNQFAHKCLYYSPPGLAMATLYADLVSEASAGEVQLLLKEEYQPGEPGWARVLASESLPVRAYRTPDRTAVAVMLKTGTYDDTVGSHFVLVDPDDPGPADEDNVPILDPAQPMSSTKRSWRLSDSAARNRGDPAIDKEWRQHRIGNLQIGGVWVFARWTSPTDVLLGSAYLQALGRLVVPLSRTVRALGHAKRVRGQK